MVTLKVFPIIDDLELVPGCDHPSWKLKHLPFHPIEKGYEIFIQPMKCYGVVGPMRAQGGTLC